MEERGVRARVNNSEAYIWEDAVQYATYGRASGFGDNQVGDFVELNEGGQIRRSPTGGNNIDASRYWGLIVGLAPDSGEYPAFGAHLTRSLVGVLAPNKTELIMRQIDDNGNYLATPTLYQGHTVMFVYNNTTRRWGVQANGNNPAVGRVIQVLSDGRLLILFGGG